MDLINRKFEYLAKNGTWKQGTILRHETDGTLTCHLDCQPDNETWPIRPNQIDRKYFLLGRQYSVS